MQFIHSGAVNMNLTTSKIMEDLVNYRSKQRFWANDFVWNCIDLVEPLAWWRRLCSGMLLSKIAVRILSNPVTSAETERSFSNFSFIHNKRRNRLSTERAGKITFVAFNAQLKLKQQQADMGSNTGETVITEIMNCSDDKNTLENEERVMDIPDDDDVEDEIESEPDESDRTDGDDFDESE